MRDLHQLVQQGVVGWISRLVGSLVLLAGRFPQLFNGRNVGVMKF